MKISNVLLATMLASAFGIQAQDSIPKISQIPKDTAIADSTQIAEISLIIKHIDSLYDRRTKNSSLPKAKKSFINVRPKPFNYCPGCGRG